MGSPSSATSGTARPGAAASDDTVLVGGPVEQRRVAATGAVQERRNEGPSLAVGGQVVLLVPQPVCQAELAAGTDRVHVPPTAVTYGSEVG